MLIPLFMKKHILSLLLLLAVVPLFAAAPADDDIALYAVATTNVRGDSVVLGDSILVTVTLYSSYNFLSAKPHKDKIPNVRNATVHRFRDGRRLSQSVGIYRDRRYYAVEVEQFFLTPDKLGTITFPTLSYKVSLTRRRNASFFDPFDPFFDFNRRQTPSVERECSSEAIKIRVVKRPPKTIDDLRRGGAHIL